MTPISELERTAIHKCLRSFGEAAEAIGFDKPLGAYSEADALLVIDAVVKRYCEAMQEEHEKLKYPPIRGKAMVADPFENPFADLEDPSFRRV